ncbi:FAD-dependent oxidoreductase [Streptomyces sp. NPDC002851]
MSSSKYLVIGAGLAGAATAWHLAQRGQEVTLVERSHPAAEDGSSHGSARIFRYAYPDPFYTGLVVTARQGWDELERLHGQRLITPSGALDFGARRTPRLLAGVLDQADIEHELLSADAARERWPQITFDTDVLWHPAAGVIDAEQSVHAMIDQAKRHGAQILTNWPVGSVTPRGPGYRVTATDGRTFDADKIVVTAGGWLHALLAELPLPEIFRSRIPTLEVRQEQAYHFPYQDGSPVGDGHEPSTIWPTFIHKTEQIETYSLPGGRDAGFRGQKLAEFNGGKVLPSAADQDGVMAAANRARVVAYVERYLPGLVPVPYAETTCLFTNTPTEDFLVDSADGITLVSPCSGHGAKFAPLIGEIAADVATGSAPGPERFALPA